MNNFHSINLVRIDNQSHLFIDAVGVEFSVFQHESFIDGGDEIVGRLEGYTPYDSNSIFNAILLEQQIIGVMRVIYPDDRGFGSFKTINDFPESLCNLESVRPENIVEIGTLAILPQFRGKKLAFLLYHQVVKQNHDYWLASVDAQLLKSFQKFGFIFEPIGPTKFYMGSPTTPVIFYIGKTIKHLKKFMPQVYRKVVLGEF